MQQGATGWLPDVKIRSYKYFVGLRSARANSDISTIHIHFRIDTSDDHQPSLCKLFDLF